MRAVRKFSSVAKKYHCFSIQHAESNTIRGSLPLSSQQRHILSGMGKGCLCLWAAVVLCSPVCFQNPWSLPALFLTPQPPMHAHKHTRVKSNFQTSWMLCIKQNTLWSCNCLPAASSTYPSLCFFPCSEHFCLPKVSSRSITKADQLPWSHWEELWCWYTAAPNSLD